MNDLEVGIAIAFAAAFLGGSATWVAWMTRQIIEHARIDATDVFVDIGSGIGRAAAIVHLLTGAKAIGVEIQPQLVRAARQDKHWGSPFLTVPTHRESDRDSQASND